MSIFFFFGFAKEEKGNEKKKSVKRYTVCWRYRNGRIRKGYRVSRQSDYRVSREGRRSRR